jgi:hypothetical protein
MPLESQGTTTTTTPTPAPTTPASQTVTIPAEQFTTYQGLQARIAELEAENTRREAAAREEQVRLLTQKGEAENAVKTLREQKDQELASERSKLTLIEERAKRYALEGELSRALAAQPLVSSAAAQQLASLFRGELQVHAEGDGFVVRTPTFQTAADFIAERLKQPEFAHFVRAGSQGGTGGQTTQATTTPSPTPSPTPVPKTMSEAVILQMKSLQSQQGNPQEDMTRGFGLRRQG